MSNAKELLNYKVDQETPKGEMERRVETTEEQQTCSHCMGTGWVLMGAERRMKRLPDKSTLEPPVWVNRRLDRPTTRHGLEHFYGAVFSITHPPRLRPPRISPSSRAGGFDDGTGPDVLPVEVLGMDLEASWDPGRVHTADGAA